jgi:hypothetical protein
LFRLFSLIAVKEKNTLKDEVEVSSLSGSQVFVRFFVRAFPRRYPAGTGLSGGDRAIRSNSPDSPSVSLGNSASIPNAFPQAAFFAHRIPSGKNGGSLGNLAELDPPH